MESRKCSDYERLSAEVLPSFLKLFLASLYRFTLVTEFKLLEGLMKDEAVFFLSFSFFPFFKNHTIWTVYKEGLALSPLGMK